MVFVYFEAGWRLRRHVKAVTVAFWRNNDHVSGALIDCGSKYRIDANACMARGELTPPKVFKLLRNRYIPGVSGIR
jgi:hypothetical protein